MTLQHLPFAIAAVIQYLAPIFTMFFTMLLIGDRIFKIQWLFVTLAFFGVALISLEDILGTNNSLSIDYFWLGWGVLSASISGSGLYLHCKAKRDRSSHKYCIVFSDGINSIYDVVVYV